MESTRLPSLETAPRRHIDTIEAPEGNGLSVCVERGGIVTSLKLNGQEVLYLEDDTLQKDGVSVRGGIPLLFPNAGPVDEAVFPGMPQHGFARISNRWQLAQDPTGRGFYESLTATDPTRRVYPHEFLAAFRGQLETDGSVTFAQEVTNKNEHGALPVSMGLHPYFKVPNGLKDKISFDFPGGHEVETRKAEWMNGKAVSIANPAVATPGAEMRVTLPDLGTLVLRVSAEYTRVWFWSLPEKDFICVEPVMRDQNGLVEDPELVEPNETYSARLNIRLE